MDLYFEPWVSDLLRVVQRQQRGWLTPSTPLSAVRSPPVLCGQLPLSSACLACPNHSAKREGTWLHFHVLLRQQIHFPGATTTCPAKMSQCPQDTRKDHPFSACGSWPGNSCGKSGCPLTYFSWRPPLSLWQTATILRSKEFYEISEIYSFRLEEFNLTFSREWGP